MWQHIWRRHDNILYSVFSHLSGRILRGILSLLARQDVQALQGCSSLLHWRSLEVQVAPVHPGHRELRHVLGGRAERALERRGLPSDLSRLGNQEIRADRRRRRLDVLEFLGVLLNLNQAREQSLKHRKCKPECIYLCGCMSCLPGGPLSPLRPGDPG